MALSYHLFTISTQVTGVSESLQYGTAVVLIGLVLAVNMLSIAFRVLPAVAQEVVARRMATHIAFRDVSVALWHQDGAAERHPRDPAEPDLRDHRPANSGKTTLLKCINRTIDFVTGVKVEGQVLVDGEDVLRIQERLRSAAADRHGVPAAGRPAAVGLRQRRLRTADGRHDATAPSSTRWSRHACGRRRCGTRSRTG